MATEYDSCAVAGNHIPHIVGLAPVPLFYLPRFEGNAGPAYAGGVATVSKLAEMKARIKKLATEAEAKKKERTASPLTAPVAKKEKSTPKEVRPPEPPKPHPNTRLPNGSRFEATYTAVTEDNGYWDCTLTIPVDGVMQRWHKRVGGIMRSFPNLDRMYRQWLKAKNQTTKENP